MDLRFTTDIGLVMPTLHKLSFSCRDQVNSKDLVHFVQRFPKPRELSFRNCDLSVYAPTNGQILETVELLEIGVCDLSPRMLEQLLGGMPNLKEIDYEVEGGLHTRSAGIDAPIRQLCDFITIAKPYLTRNQTADFITPGSHDEDYPGGLGDIGDWTSLQNIHISSCVLSYEEDEMIEKIDLAE